MSTYLLINIIIIAVPLILSFEKKIQFYKNFPAVLVSIISIGSVYLLWDIAATARGDWAFNPTYVLGLKIFNLPFEEILFFITVPYSTLFIYKTVTFYLSEKIYKINKKFIYSTAVTLLITSVLFTDKNYTFTVLLFTGIFLIIAQNFYKEILLSRIYWVTIIISFIPFLIVNYFLTSLPVVTYNDEAIWGTRFITIPAEDFFYSYSMISFFIIGYLTAKNYLFARKTKMASAGS